ncbi:hypothetical protein Ocin01_18388, partial [Orchesella cincta]
IQNITSSSLQAPDRLRCAQTLLDELLAQHSRPISTHESVTHTDLIADQAKSDNEGDDHVSQTLNSAQYTDNLTKEMQLQRQEILELKAEISKLNISQVLLMRTVDEETLKV